MFKPFSGHLFRRQPIRLLVPAIVVGFLLVHRAFLTPDVIFVVLLAVFLAYGMALEYIKKFSPFVILLLTYDALRGLVPFISKNVHFTEMIDFDVWLGFGVLPTQRLQEWLYNGYLQWYDFYLYGLYMMHFVVPLLVGVLIWRTRPGAYWAFVWSLLALSYAGFVTFALYPAAPPWMASEMGYIYPIHKISTDIWHAFGVEGFPTVYAKMNPNPVAAVPSLHSAYPMLAAMFVTALYQSRWRWLIWIYPLSIWFGVVYMGEHYVIDVMLGAAYAAAAYYFTPKVINYWHRWRSRRKQTA